MLQPIELSRGDVIRPKIRASGIKGSRGRTVYMTHTASEIILCDACCSPLNRLGMTSQGQRSGLRESRVQGAQLCIHESLHIILCNTCCGQAVALSTDKENSTNLMHFPISIISKFNCLILISSPIISPKAAECLQAD